MPSVSYINQLNTNRPHANRADRVSPTLIGQSPAMTVLKQRIEAAAPKDSTVLIQGETGTGKELIAKSLHAGSQRTGRFVAINCAAIPHDLLESELFGHERGAFTGAAMTREGKIEYADKGTLFLDEIGDMPLSLQAKLLRFLEERTYSRLGANHLLRANVRLIAATHQDLMAAVREGRFRADLFYRLNVIQLLAPPLRARVEDLDELIGHLQAALSKRLTCRPVRFSIPALGALARYPWPGNVRELANLIEQLMVFHAGETIHVKDLPAQFGGVDRVVSPGENHALLNAKTAHGQDWGLPHVPERRREGPSLGHPRDETRRPAPDPCCADKHGATSAPPTPDIETLDDEEWLPIPGYEGYYEVSTRHRVKSVSRTLFKSDGTVQRWSSRLKRCSSGSVALSRQGKAQSFSVALLLEAAQKGVAPADLPPDTQAPPDEAGEHWLPIPGFEDRYEVSSRERVRTLARFVTHSSGGYWKPCKILARRPYGVVLLNRNGKKTGHSIKRLLEEAKAAVAC